MEQDRNKVFMENQKIVYFTFNKYYSSFWRDKEDLLQEGFLGLWKCIDKFDASKGEFSTFATTAVKNAMALWLRKDKRGENKVVSIEDASFEDEDDKYSFLDLANELEQDKYSGCEVRSVLAQTLGCFNEPYRGLIINWVEQKETHREAAKKLHCSKQYISLIINKFREIFIYIWEHGELPPPPQKNNRMLKIS